MILRKSIFIALWFLLVTIAWLALEKLLGFHDVYIQYHTYFANLVLIPNIFIFNRAISGYRKSIGGTITYLQAFGFGLICTVFIVLFSPLALWVFETILNPNFYQSMIQYLVTQKHENQAETAKYFNHENYRNMMIYGNIVQGAVLSAIIAFFSSKKRT